MSASFSLRKHYLRVHRPAAVLGMPPAMSVGHRPTGVQKLQRSVGLPASSSSPATSFPPPRAGVSYSQSLPIRLAMWWQRQQWYDELTASYVVVWVGIGGLAVLVLWALIEGGWL